MAEKIKDYRIGAPPTWGSWVPREAAGHVDAVAEKVATGEAAQARVREAVLLFDATVPVDTAPLTAAVWVPEPSTGEIYGFLFADLLRGETGAALSAEVFLQRVKKAPRERGVKLFDHSTSAAEVEAGPAVIEMRRWAEKGSGQVLSSVAWTIFAPGASEAVRLEFTTPVAQVFDALTDESVVIANTVRLELGEPV